jgi:hypothetical protein
MDNLLKKDIQHLAVGRDEQRQRVERAINNERIFSSHAPDGSTWPVFFSPLNDYLQEFHSTFGVASASTVEARLQSMIADGKQPVILDIFGTVYAGAQARSIGITLTEPREYTPLP